MKRDIFILRFLTVFSLLSLFIILRRKPNIKDWVIVYLFNGFTNGIIDKLITTFNIVEYPVRFLPKIFKIHILFDFLIYPTFTIFLNQITEKDKPFTIVVKLLALTIPMFIVEFIAEKKTNLVRWKKGWNWYHSFSGLIGKSLITRTIIGVIRMVDIKQAKTQVEA